MRARMEHRGSRWPCKLGTASPLCLAALKLPKSSASAQQPCPPSTRPGLLPSQSPDAEVMGSYPLLQQLLPAAGLSPGQPWASLGEQSPRHCVPGPRCRGKGSMGAKGDTPAAEHPPLSFLSKLPTSPSPECLINHVPSN